MDFEQWKAKMFDKWSHDPACSLEVEPLPDIDVDGTSMGQHLLLGITMAGMQDFMKRIDFPFWYCSIHGLIKQHDGSYVRNEKDLGWVTEKCGPVRYFDENHPCTKPLLKEWNKEMKCWQQYWHPFGFKAGSPDPRSATGYDLVYTIRLWLQAVGKTNVSVNEILYAEKIKAAYIGVEDSDDEDSDDEDSDDEDWEPKPPQERTYEATWAVQMQPHAFISHVQIENVGVMSQGIECGCLYNGMRDTLGAPNCVPLQGSIPDLYWWLDYFVLRQCKADFSIPAVQKVIEKTGCTLVVLDMNIGEVDKARFLTYIKRSFCVFEVYSTVVGHATMAIAGAMNLNEYIAKNPINTKIAESFWMEEKKMIDDFIVENIDGGFAGLDDIITDAILDGLEHGNNMRIVLPIELEEEKESDE